MNKLPLISYAFSGGVARNADGSQPGQAQNVRHVAVNANLPGWGALKDALSFGGAGSHVAVPTPDALRATTGFAVELALRLNALGEDRMNLFEGSDPAVSFNLRRLGGGYALRGGLHTAQSWRGIQTETPVVMPNVWVAVALVQTGEELTLFVNGQPAARRVFRPAVLVATGAADFKLGTWHDGRTFQFVGDVAGLRVWGDVPPHLERGLEAAERAGLGEIESRYLDLNAHAGPLGEPTGPEQAVARGRQRSYKGGDIFWSPERGARVVQDDILTHYRKHGGPGGVLGFPASDEQTRPQLGLKVSNFEDGAIYWSEKDGARAVHGEIFAHYVYLDAERGPLGPPTSDELISPLGRRGEFKGGVIFYSNEVGPSALSGDILNCYRYQLRGTGGPLGLPVSGVEEIRMPGGASTGGKVARFQNGSIYWSRRTGAYSVQGDIRRLYEESGGPLGPLGYPKSHEQGVAGSDLRYNDFENGVVLWRPQAGARMLSALQLHLGMVRSGKIKDGINVFPPSGDSSAELMVYTTVNVDGQPRETERQHGNHHGTSYDINTNYDVAAVSGATTIDFRIRVKDYDSDSTDDYLCTIEKRFDIKDCWGMDSGENGLYINQPATDKGETAPRLDSVTFDYRIGPPSAAISPDEPFRKRAWWNFENFKTPQLSRRIYSNTFRDVEMTGNGWEEFMHPFDTLFYHLIYKGLAGPGNCFGSSLEAQFALAGRSLFAEPIRQYALSNGVREVINVKHGYQVSGAHLRWIVGKLKTLDPIRPLKVYSRVRATLEQGEKTLVSMVNVPSFDGHTVLAYGFEDGKSGAPHKIFVANPDAWQYDESSPDPSFIEVRGDDTFGLMTNGRESYKSRRFAGVLPTTFMLDTPLHVFSSPQRTPFWEVIQGLARLIGGIIALAGDAEAAELKGDGADYYRPSGAGRDILPGAIPEFSRVPYLVTGRHGLPELYAQRGYPSHKFEMTVRGKPTPGGSNSFQCGLRTAKNSLLLDSPIAANSSDRLSVTGTRSSSPLFEAATDEEAKVGRVVYSVLMDDHGRDARAVETNLGMARGVKARVGAEPRAAGFVVENAGPARPLSLTFTTVENGQARRSVLSLGAQAARGVLRLRPKDWVSPHNEMVVERLDSLDSGVVSRTVERVRPAS